MSNNVLFIHGLHSDKDSSTGQQVRQILEGYGYTVISETFDVLDYDKTMNRIKELKKEYKAYIIVGHSLGGFYALMSAIESFTILINPCLMPEVEIPKLLFEGESVSDELKTKWKEAREHFWYWVEPEDKPEINGIFAKNDELFSYADLYDSKFMNMQMIEGGHKVSTEALEGAFENIFAASAERYRRNPKGLSFPPLEMDETDKLVAYYNYSQYHNPDDIPEIKKELESKGIPTGKAEYKAWYIKWLKTEFK